MDINEGDTISAVMAAAQQVIVVKDSTKFGRKGCNVMLPVEEIDIAIADRDAPNNAIE